MKVEKLSVSSLRVHPDSQGIYQDEPNEELLNSVRAMGVLTPLIIAADQMTIISGRRRYKAAVAVGFDTVPAVVDGSLIDECDIAEAIVSTNVHTERTTEQKAREFALMERVEKIRAKRRRDSGDGSSSSSGVSSISSGSSSSSAVSPEHAELSPTSDHRINFSYGPDGGQTGEQSSPDVETGRAAEIAAEKVGMSRHTAQKASKIVNVVDELRRQGSDEDADKIRDALNKSVSAAGKLVDELVGGGKEKKAKAKKSKAKESAKETKSTSDNAPKGGDSGGDDDAGEVAESIKALKVSIRKCPKSLYRELRTYYDLILKKLEAFDNEG